MVVEGTGSKLPPAPAQPLSVEKQRLEQMEQWKTQEKQQVETAMKNAITQGKTLEEVKYAGREATGIIVEGREQSFIDIHSPATINNMLVNMLNNEEVIPKQQALNLILISGDPPETLNKVSSLIDHPDKYFINNEFKIEIKDENIVDDAIFKTRKDLFVITASNPPPFSFT